MEITAQVEEDLKRFGCKIDCVEKRVYVSLRDLDPDSLLKATILVRPAYTKWSKAPLFCLAFEISATRTLPRYSYYPFNLADASQVDFILGVASDGELHFTFLGAEIEVLREQTLRPWQTRLMKQMCEMGTSSIRGMEGYEFSTAVKEFEATFRLPQLFERVAQDEHIARVIDAAKAEAAGSPVERLALAQQMCHSFAEIIKARSASLTDEEIRLLYTLRAFLMLFVEFYREFGNYDDLAEFVANILCTRTQDEAVLKTAIEWCSQLDAGLRWLEQVIPAFEANRDGVRTGFLDSLGKTLGDVARGRELTLPMLLGIFTPLQPLLSSRPGRPTKDYSREFEWKFTMSWTEVAQKSLRENPDFREEFAGREFDSLDFEQREALKGRIREGVKSWARKNGRQMPSSSRDYLPD